VRFHASVPLALPGIDGPKEPELRADPIRRVVDVRRAGTAARLGWMLLWLALAVLGIEFLHTVHLKYASLDSPAYGMFLTRRGWLWCHLGGGAVGIVLGTLQFATQRWHRHPRVHRWTGRAYFVGMLVAMFGAAGLIATSPAPIAIRLAFAATSLAWLVTALAGFVAIRHGRVGPHRRWMECAYLVTLAPAVFRIALHGAVGAGTAPSPATIAVLLWCSWAVPVLVYVLGRRAAEAVHDARRARAAAG